MWTFADITTRSRHLSAHNICFGQKGLAFCFEEVDKVTISRGQEWFGIIAGQVHLVRVDEADEGLEDVRIDADDIHTIRSSFFHVVLEHGGEHTPGSQDEIERWKFPSGEQKASSLLINVKEITQG